MSISSDKEILQQFRIIIGSARRHLASIEKECNISGAQVWMLSVIDASPNITVSGLSKNLSIHISTASNMLNKLTDAGLVSRTRDKSDRRVVTMRLTAKGKKLLKRAPTPIIGLIPYALSKLPQNTLERLNKDLGKLIKEMNVVDDLSKKPLSELILKD